MQTTKRPLGDLVQIMVNTRDFCGNVFEAVWEWEEENGKLTEDERSEAYREFLAVWAEFERMAKEAAR